MTLTAFLLFFAASIFAVLFGWGAARIIGNAFERGNIPEFLKAPVLFAVVIFTFVFADEIMHETGLACGHCNGDDDGEYAFDDNS